MPTPLYGPYGSPLGLPPLAAGVDDEQSLRLTCLRGDTGASPWQPRLHPGRYTLRSEKNFRYLYAKPRTLSLALSQGLQSISAALPHTSGKQKAFSEAPVRLSDSTGRLYTALSNTIRFAYPVPPQNVLTASSLIQADYLNAGGPDADSQLWWLPTFGAEVLAGYRSQSPRSWDVLSDRDAALYEVSTPDQLSDDRSYCLDRALGIVYGLMPATTLPPPPFSTGQNAQTYLTLAYPLGSDPANAHSLASKDASWTAYFTARSAFLAAYEGSAVSFYDPLRLEEIGFVDSDGLIRVRHAGGYSPSAVFIAPAGPILLTTTMSGNLISALTPDPTRNGQLVPLPYGATVLVRYYVPNTFCMTGLSTTNGVDSLNLRVNVETSGPWTLTYESEPGGTASFSGLDLSTHNHPARGGFLWIEDTTSPAPAFKAVSGVIGASTTAPLYFSAQGKSETIIVRCSGLDDTGTEITGITLSLTATGSATVTGTGMTGPDGEALFKVTVGSSVTALTLSSGGTVLAVQTILPSIVDDVSWDPSIVLILGEDYLAAADTNAARRYVKVSIIQPDGFPWLPTEKSGTDAVTGYGAQVVLSSRTGVFHSPAGQADAVLGSEVTVPLTGPSDFRQESGIVVVGYAPVDGDVLTAAFITGTSRYVSEPIAVQV